MANFAQTANARISIGLGPGLVAVTVHLSGLLVQRNHDVLD